MQKTNFKLFLVAALVFSCSVVGCNRGPNVQLVEGVVLFKGEPLFRANVSFAPKTEGSGIYATGDTDEQGHFLLSSMQGGAPMKGAVVGEYDVCIVRMKDEPAKWVAAPVNPDGSVNPSGKIPIYESMIPARYRDNATSGLSATVVKGKNTFKFELEDK